MRFEWEVRKNNINKVKHGVSFEDAETVFDDDNAIIFNDSESSFDEERFIIIGMDLKNRELVVCHCYREDSEIVRIFSARKATKKECKLYWSSL